MNFGKDQQCLLNVGGAENSETRRTEVLQAQRLPRSIPRGFPTKDVRQLKYKSTKANYNLWPFIMAIKPFYM